MYRLYVKTHNKTGLKYLGKTSRKDWEKYSGSGTRWKNHLIKHGDNISTKIIFQTDDLEEFKKVATEYSEKWNIVESEDWANLKIEEGDGGWSHINAKGRWEGKNKVAWNKGKKLTPIEKEKLQHSYEKSATSRVGLKWWTNGTETIKSRECPGPEWKRGRSNHHITPDTRKKLSETSSGRKFTNRMQSDRSNIKRSKKMSKTKHYNNSKISIRVIPGTEPEGFVPGRLKR